MAAHVSLCVQGAESMGKERLLLHAKQLSLHLLHRAHEVDSLLSQSGLGIFLLRFMFSGLTTPLSLITCRGEPLKPCPIVF